MDSRLVIDEDECLYGLGCGSIFLNLSLGEHDKLSATESGHRWIDNI